MWSKTNDDAASNQDASVSREAPKREPGRAVRGGMKRALTSLPLATLIGCALGALFALVVAALSLGPLEESRHPLALFALAPLPGLLGAWLDWARLWRPSGRTRFWSLTLLLLTMAAALEDADQIAVVGLNELAEGATPRLVSPRELVEAQEGPVGPRELTGERVDRLAQHRGGTPCRSALARAQELLEGAASAGAPQTLLMLTDGACNGGKVEGAERWLGGLRAHRGRRGGNPR